MRYVKARLDRADRDEAYRIYITDVLRLVSGRDGLPRFYELVYPQEVKETDAEEIIERIMNGVNQL